MRVQPPPSLTLFDRYRNGNLLTRPDLLEEVSELVSNVIYLHPDDLLRILKAGYRNMTTKDRDEFMRKVLLELRRATR